jgi:tetraacyldisaccharide 4'-kinase
MSLALAPLELLYGAVTRTRLALYGAGLLRTYEVDAPVVSVGNITTGGTGKTPLVEWLARTAASAGRRVCVLTRGYGRADVRARVLVSDGLRVLASVQEGGDEPRLLAEQLLGLAAVVADADRAAAASWAQRELQSDLFILDDGFQHLRLARDLNIVTLDASAPWGGRHLLPRGRLREPLTGLRRADCIVITRAELAPDLDSLRATVAQLSNARPIFNARAQTRALRSRAAKDEQATAFAALPQPLAAFCALGNPQAFFAHVRSAGCELSATRALPDHHGYTQADVDELERTARQHGARALITTAKDEVKLRPLDFSLPCYVLEIGLAFDDEAGLRALLFKTLATNA